MSNYLLRLLQLLFLIGVGVNSKPTFTALEGEKNEMNVGTPKDYRSKIFEDSSPSGRSMTSLVPSSSRNDFYSEFEENVNFENGSKLETRNLPETSKLENNLKTNGQPQQRFDWILAPATVGQKVQFSPETFFQERIGQIKDAVNHLGSVFPNQQNADGKQLPNYGLANLVGLNDSRFYTNRFDPVGFFGGNGWLANKGGIIGGPGAIISTGSLLTDYPTAYKK